MSPEKKSVIFSKNIGNIGNIIRLFLPTTPTKECSMSQTLLEMAKDLVMAQIEAHQLSPEEMHQALQHTHTSLLALKAQEGANGRVAVVTPETT